MTRNAVASVAYVEHAVPSPEAMAYLLRALYDADTVRGRDRAPGVDNWVKSLRVEIIGLLPKDLVDTVLADADELRTRLEG